MRLELTKRADYAIRAVVALATAAPDERLSVRRIAAEQGIPARFLPQAMGDLVAAGIVAGVAGRTGGYRLARPATAISLLEVIEAVEGDSRRETCVLRGGPCSVNGVCTVHRVFAATQEGMLRQLSSASIAGLALDRGTEPATDVARLAERRPDGLDAAARPAG
ncbi:MAG TPA: Rrf2 family transcriptional regulator [Candidatus Deferrimicrobium sp.]|nr:Rrf2 family transcriptional regulator [Candidatus Deferrimicrobium sp.]